MRNVIIYRGGREFKPVGRHGPKVAELVRMGEPAIRTNPAGVAAILNALNGGAGHEFATLVRRELHNPGAVLNGLALSKIRPYGATFLIFSDYMKPAIRLSALMELPTIHVFTQ